MTAAISLTKSSDIALHITELIGGISIANGFLTDIGTLVFRGKQYKQGDQVPCAVIIEGEDQVGDQDGRDSIKIVQEYVVGGYVVCDPDNPNDAAHDVLHDLKRAIFPPSSTGRPQLQQLPGTVNKVKYRGRDIGARPAGESIVFAVIYLDVTYAENLSDA